MISFKRFDHFMITVPVGRAADARQFFGGTLELKEIPGQHPGGAIWFEMAGIELHVREEEGTNNSARHQAFEVSDLEQSKQFLASKDIAISYSTDIAGRDRCFFRDPFGNRFELLQFKS